ncbi:bifunctional diguanylate cyclase/phosphodiesterase [Paramagnetospirillum magnetotacticum]|nr:EAL domain-containing protein [Paramagnetospirillum magnetotacticum]
MTAAIQNLDLKTKIVVACVGMFVAAIWLLAHDVAEEIRDDVTSVISAEQAALVDHITDSLEEESKLRINTLKDIASLITPELMGNNERLGEKLAAFKHVGRLFNLGLSVVSRQGIGVADFPALNGRAGYDFSGEDYFPMIMAGRDVAISRPRLGRFSSRPIVLLAVPIRGPADQIIGILVGSNSVSDSDFFTEIIPRQSRLEGEFHIISPKDRLYVASTRKERILQPLPAAGVNRMLDRYVEGYEGSGISINSQGIEVLSSSKRIESVGWAVIATMPTSVAFAPIQRLTFEIYKDAALASLIIAILLWLFVRRQLAPLEHSAEMLNAMASGNRPLSPLPVEGGPEIRQLLDSFNKFHDRISSQKQSLRDNAEQLVLAASVFDGTSEAIAITDAEGLIVSVNKPFCRLTGYDLEELVGQNPKILKSGRHDAAFYAEMWQSIVTSGNWSGEVWNRRKNGEIYPERLTISTIYDGEGQVQRRVAIASDITTQKKAEEIIWHQANHDLLTGLPNRQRFLDLLRKDLARADGLPDRVVGVLLVDLDRFKEINDTLGHAIGDQLLLEVVRRIRSCLSETDVVGHLGADEFIVSMVDDLSTARIEATVAAIRMAIAEPFHSGSDTVHLTASIGITAYPTDGGDIEELLRNVDQAVREAKDGGRDRSCCFTESMREAGQTRLQLANDLREALVAGQFEVYYQPIIDMPSRTIVKAEALLRWRHPERGFVSPALFIPIAEETGLISDIGNWVFRQAAATARRLCDRCPYVNGGICRKAEMAGPNAPCLFQIAVNKSPRQFFSGFSHLEWAEHLRQLNISPQCISIEVTEGLLLGQHADVMERLSKFRAAGMQIALDDFGTGYSAMSYLKRFDIDYIKIDQSFVRDMTDDSSDRAIAEAIIVMAHRLGMKVVAEGIETEEQYALLAAAGCDFGQGYLFARPMPVDQFEQLVGRLDEPAALPQRSAAGE